MNGFGIRPRSHVAVLYRVWSRPLGWARGEEGINLGDDALCLLSNGLVDTNLTFWLMGLWS